MILVDANLLLYAKLSSFEEHGRAHQWLDDQLNGTTQVGLPWQSLLAFLRLSTNPRLFPRPLSMRQGWKQVLEWRSLPSTWTPTPGSDHEKVMGRLLEPGGISPRLVMDTHLAALAIEHGLALCSADGDFGRFPELHWINPLAG